jgi:tRNA1(Val) A37 N6-methylase TrmN6
MREIKLASDERIDQLSDTGVKIIQSRSVFSFSTDAVLLANFPKIPKQGLIVDFCAGNGAVGFFASAKTNAQIVSFEIQHRLAEMAQRSVALNALEAQMSIVNDNLNQALSYLPPTSVDLIFCNPPYFKIEKKSTLNENKHYSLARHEVATNLDEIFEMAKKLLKSKGHLALVHRPDRFFEITDKMRKYHLIPKRIQFVYPKAGRSANLLLIDAIKDGNEGGEVFLPPLLLHNK